LGARERPLALVPLDELLSRMAHLQQDLGLLAPARILALEKMGEEFLLQPDAIVGVEVGPVLDAVHLEPLLLGGGAHETLEIAARVQALAAPVGGGKERGLDLAPVRHARAPKLVGVELARDAVLVEIAPVLAELFLRQRLRSRDPVAVDAALEAARAAPVL